MEDQRTRARNARGESSYMGSEELAINKLDASINTEFVGYTETECEGKVLALATDADFKDSLNAGEEGSPDPKILWRPDMGSSRSG